MAVYGYDAYGRSKYGPFVKVDYGVDPFVVSALDYSRTYLTWNEPVGPWDKFLLLRSRSGFATAPDDGAVLISFTKTDSSPPVDTQYLDPNLVGGWYYYTILLHSTQSEVWEVAAATSVLVPWDYESTEALWNSIPEFYRVVNEGQTAGYSEVLFQINPAIYQSGDNTVVNEQLFKFLSVFGWGYDILRSQIETIRNGFDPATVHVSRLTLLADMFGAVLPDTVPTQNNRNLVRNLALLYRKRGTLDGLRENLALTSGWDVDVYQGPNFLLSRDQSAFVDLNVQPWDPGSWYVTGDIVRYNNYYRQALQPAYGPSQAPPSSPTSNSYWSINPFTQSSPYIWDPYSASNSTLQRLHGWQVQQYTSPFTVYSIGLGLGIVNPLSAAPDGSLTWVNTTTTLYAPDVLVRSTPILSSSPGSPPDREDVVKYGIPVPRITARWKEGESYFRGDRVFFNGAAYEARTETTDDPSADSWQKIGFNNRPRINLSFYAHGPFTGTAGSGSLLIQPWVAFYDEQGTELVSRTCVQGHQFYDSFTREGSLISGRLPDAGSYTWNGPDFWGQAADDLGGYAYPISTGATSEGFTAASNGNAGVTFRRIKERELGLFFRRTDASNFWCVTQSGLFKVVSGTPVQVGTPFTCAEWDRVTVSFNGTTITVQKNGTTVVTTTDSFNQTGTGVGVYAEDI